jgi:hypothetical protein
MSLDYFCLGGEKASSDQFCAPGKTSSGLATDGPLVPAVATGGVLRGPAEYCSCNVVFAVSAKIDCITGSAERLSAEL